jgi:hydrogenase maturation protease
MSDALDVWGELERQGPDSVTVNGIELRPGSRVLLAPREGGDIFNVALAGRIGVVEKIEHDIDDSIHLAVTLEDDPGRDLGESRFPAHRFFFAPDEVEPIAGKEGEPAVKRVLVAGIGNIFLGDDGFGVEVVSRLRERALPPGVDVVDFGIRGMDLAYALAGSYDAAVLVDAAARGEAPGTLSVIEPEIDEGEAMVETHALDPVKVLRLARELGGIPRRTLVVACEPELVVAGEPDEDVVVELSASVRGAVEGAVGLVEELVGELRMGNTR